MSTSGRFTNTPVIRRQVDLLSGTQTTGNLTLTASQVPAGWYRWVVRRTTSTTSTGSAVLNVYDNVQDIQHLLAQDTITGSSTLFFAEIKELHFPGNIEYYVFSGLSLGAIAYVTIYSIEVLIDAYNNGVIPS